jgi:hypothetical protein
MIRASIKSTHSKENIIRTYRMEEMRRGGNALCDYAPANVGTTTHDYRTTQKKMMGEKMREVSKHIKPVVHRCIGGSTVP